jgi:DNA-binding GntR family transcriptional regulator
MPSSAVPAKDRVYAFVKERVLSGAYPGGELLSEGEVAAALGVSRTPVREAFLLLEAEDLMRLYPKRGALVVPVSPDEIRDVVEARRLVERHSVSVVAAARPPGLVAQLRSLVREQEEREAAGDTAGFVDADRRFHHAIVAAAGNAVILRLYDSLRDRQRRMVSASIARDPRAIEAFITEHQAIVGAIAGGRAEHAGELIAEHITSAGARLQT